MTAKKFTVSMEPDLLERLDRLVKSRSFRSRSQAVQVAVREKVERLKHSRLARECGKIVRSRSPRFFKLWRPV